jgi:hypothetical protein
MFVTPAPLMYSALNPASATTRALIALKAPGMSKARRSWIAARNAARRAADDDDMDFLLSDAPLMQDPRQIGESVHSLARQGFARFRPILDFVSVFQHHVP